MKRATLFKILIGAVPVLLAFFASNVSGADDESPDNVMIFAAASTTNAVSEIKALFVKTKNVQATVSFASSSTLAKQIARGAPVHLFISANPKWMTFLEERNQIEPDTSCNLLGNRIVLIGPVDLPVETIDIRPGLDLEPVLGDGFVSMGDPDHVPAGMYAKKALIALGIWGKIKTRIVRAKDVRSALVFVERAETPLGVVYATDAAISKKVRVVGIFPEKSHPPIVYKAALVKGNATRLAKEFMAFLKSAPAGKIFKKYGFYTKQ